MEFLLLALVLIIIGVGIVGLRNRSRTGVGAGINDFEARRRALAPEVDESEQGGDSPRG